MSLTSQARAAALLAALTLSSPALADGAATILFPDMCGDPSNWFDYAWAATVHKAEALVVVSDASTITLVHASKDVTKLSEITDAYLAAHGCGSTIGNIAAGKVATLLQGLTAGKTALFAVCSAAKGTGSPLQVIQAANTFGTLYGGAGSVALTGNGSADIAKAKYMDSPSQSNTSLFSSTEQQIGKNWLKTGYISKYSSQSPQEKCADALKNVGSKPEELAGLKDDIVSAFDSDYMTLVKLNINGKDLVACGKDTSMPTCP